MAGLNLCSRGFSFPFSSLWALEIAISYGKLIFLKSVYSAFLGVLNYMKKGFCVCVCLEAFKLPHRGRQQRSRPQS